MLHVTVTEGLLLITFSLFVAISAEADSMSVTVSGSDNGTKSGTNGPTSKSTTVSQKINRRQRHIRSLRTLGVVMATFLVCWLPFCLFWPIVAYCPTCISMPVYEYSYWSAYLNSTINPLAYFLSNKDFREALKNLFKRNS